MVTVGQAYFGKISFKDGEIPLYSRPYLVVEVLATGAHVLNVSSTVGKEQKLLYSTNYNLTNFRPPFLKPTFVKLDSKTFVPNADFLTLALLDNGNCLNQKDLNLILSKLNYLPSAL